MDELKQLKEARKQNDLYKKLVKDEMYEMGIKGELWTNRQCKHWPDYEKSLERLNELREQFKT